MNNGGMPHWEYPQGLNKLVGELAHKAWGAVHAFRLHPLFD